jgi:hypothetical protein
MALLPSWRRRFSYLAWKMTPVGSYGYDTHCIGLICYYCEDDSVHQGK